MQPKSLHTVSENDNEEIKKNKGYTSELNFSQRKEILMSIKYVSKVIKSKWLIKENFLKKNKIHYLVHGNDNSNIVKKNKLIIFKRTKGISSTILRKRSKKIIEKNG